MFMGPGNQKESERYYLFAGMGGRAARRKQKLFLQWSVIAGLLVALSLAVAMYYFNRPIR
jgi:hypothetical protein